MPMAPIVSIGCGRAVPHASESMSAYSLHLDVLCCTASNPSSDLQDWNTSKAFGTYQSDDESASSQLVQTARKAE